MAEGTLSIAPPVPEGVTLEEALLRWGDPAIVAEVSRLAAEGYDIPAFIWTLGPETECERNVGRYRSLRGKLEEVLHASLRSGILVATGYDARAAIDASPVTIPADRWRVLVPDFSASSATVSGLTITGILVFENAPLPTMKPNRIPGTVAPAKLKAWYRKWVEQNVGSNTKPTRDEDWAAAKVALGDGVPRDVIHRLRRELAPDAWRRRGRRKLTRETAD